MGAISAETQRAMIRVSLLILLSSCPLFSLVADEPMEDKGNYCGRNAAKSCVSMLGVDWVLSDHTERLDKPTVSLGEIQAALNSLSLKTVGHEVREESLAYLSAMLRDPETVGVAWSPRRDEGTGHFYAVQEFTGNETMLLIDGNRKFTAQLDLANNTVILLVSKNSLRRWALDRHRFYHWIGSWHASLSLLLLIVGLSLYFTRDLITEKFYLRVWRRSLSKLILPSLLRRSVKNSPLNTLMACSCFLLFVLFVTACLLNSRDPGIRLTPETLELGSLPVGRVFDGTMTILNESATDTRILGANVSCTCVEIELPEVLKANSETRLPVKIRNFKVGRNVYQVGLRLPDDEVVKGTINCTGINSAQLYPTGGFVGVLSRSAKQKSQVVATLELRKVFLLERPVLRMRLADGDAPVTLALVDWSLEMDRLIVHYEMRLKPGGTQTGLCSTEVLVDVMTDQLGTYSTYILFEVVNEG